MTQTIQQSILTARITELEKHCYNGGIGLPMIDYQGSACLVYPTGFCEAHTFVEIRDWRLQDGTGYITRRQPRQFDGISSEPSWRWYGRGKPNATLAQLLASLACAGDIITEDEARDIQHGNIHQ